MAATDEDVKAESGEVPADDAAEAQRMPLLAHLIELRTRLLISVGSLILAFFVCFAFAEDFYEFLTIPLKEAMAGAKISSNRMIFTGLIEGFFTQVKVAFFAALCITFPIFGTQIWRFIAPGLYKSEKKAFLPFLFQIPRRVAVLSGIGGAIYIGGAVGVELATEVYKHRNELNTLEYNLTTVLEEFMEMSGVIIFLFAVARISAGVDLGQVGPDDVVINEATNSITLTLPSPTITAVEMDNEQTRVYDRDTGLFTSGDMDLEREARLAAEDLMVEAAIQDGIRERARESSQLAMEELLTSLGYDQVIIRFAPAD